MIVLVKIKAKVRYTTLIILPKSEQILDFTCGDKEFWVINGAQNLAYVKPAKPGSQTNLNLITASGNIYSFVLTEVSKLPNGEPDLKVTTPNDFAMYANGPDWWIDQFADVELTEDRWIKAMEIKPSNPKIVHHVVVYVIEPDAPEGTPESGVQLHEYAVGKYGDIFGENTGRLLKKGTKLRYDMHYFAIGSEQHNKTTIAFKFYPKGVVPKYQVRSFAIRNIPNDDLEVPPNTMVRTDGFFKLPKNARIDSFQPHMHMRGRGLTVEAIDPATNRSTVLSSVDHFDFNWHINYVYADDEAPLLPAGTVLHLIGVHDNTQANRRNPDPNMWVGFGERSVDDMLQVWLDIVYLDDAEFQRLVEERKGRASTTGGGQNR